jgi:hypothetical protein
MSRWKIRRENRFFKPDTHEIWGEYILKDGTEIRIAKYRIYKREGDKVYLKEIKSMPRYLKIDNRTLMQSNHSYSFTKVIYYGGWCR